MRRFTSVLLVAVYTGAVFMGGMLIGQLYALYVLVYTGALFIIGVWLGQCNERRWVRQTAAVDSASIGVNRRPAESEREARQYSARGKGG